MRSALDWRVAACLLAAHSACAKEPGVLELGPDDRVVALAEAGGVLAVGVGHRARYDARVSREIPADQSQVLLLRHGSEVARSQLERGVLRDIVATRSGFVVLRVVPSPAAGAVEAHVSSLALDGTERSLPTLAANVIGVFVDAQDDVYAYTSSKVMLHPRSGGGWQGVDAFPDRKEPISRIVALDGGPVAVAGTRSVSGFGRIGGAPLFRKDFGMSNYPLELHGAGGSWWIVSPSEREQKVMRLDRQGAVLATITMRDVLIQNLLFWGGKVVLVCSGKGQNVHRTFFCFWNALDDGAITGPFDLPNDITKSCIWGGSLVSGGSGRKMFSRPLPEVPTK